MTFNDGKDVIIEYFCQQVVYKSVVISLQRIIFDHLVEQQTLNCKNCLYEPIKYKESKFFLFCYFFACNPKRDLDD